MEFLGVMRMKLLKVIDNQILNFWYAYPEDRFWAYLATMPAVILIIDLLFLVFD